ncbi:MAG: MATE family efflux transporter [Pseudomonadales bacterium]|nr:MATE family efflux transporter [Pseudomonadales bacterium]
MPQTQPPATTIKSKISDEISTLFGLGWPILITQLSGVGLGVVDTIMAGHAGSEHLAAVGIGSGIWIPVFLFMIGLLYALTPNIAQLWGAGRESEIPAFITNGALLALIICVPLFFLLRNTEPLLQAMSLSDELIKLTDQYLHGLSWGMPASGLFFVLRYALEGVGKTRPAMKIGLLALILNVPLNYIFIYGKLGLPALGGPGCGYASALVQWMTLGLILFAVKASSLSRLLNLRASYASISPTVIWNLIKLGGPMGVSRFAESSVFAFLALFIGHLGSVAVAGHSIALNFSGLLFMVPLSISMAISVHSGHLIGRGDYHRARFASYCGMGLAVFIATIHGTLTYLFREQIVHLYTSEPEVMLLAMQLLVFAAMFQIADGIQVSAIGALHAYKDTRIPMYITLFSYLGVGFPVGYILGLTDYYGAKRGPAGLWIGLVVALVVAALLLLMRLHKTTRVTKNASIKSTTS